MRELICEEIKYMFKRLGLMLIVNIAVMITVMTILKVLGVEHYVTSAGLNYSALMVFCLVWGMVGSFISWCARCLHAQSLD